MREKNVEMGGEPSNNEQAGISRRDLLALAADYADESICVTTADLKLPGPKFVYVNTAFTKMTGYSVGELLGKTPRILQGPRTNLETLKTLRSDLQAGRDFIGRTVNYCRDGTPFEIEWIIGHVRNEAGVTTHYVALQHDITGQQRVRNELMVHDQALRDAKERLFASLARLEAAERELVRRERLAAMAQMAAGMVHDLRNGVMPISTLAESLAKRKDLPSEAKQNLESIKTAAAYLYELLERLQYLDPRSKPDKPLQMVDLQTLCRRVPDIVRSKWDRLQNEIRFELDLCDELFVRIAPNELTRVLVNLANNAIDAMPEGGTITMRLSRMDTHACIDFIDTGIGMSPEIMQNCFEPYHTTKTHGSGLGLSICSTIVTKYGGEIAVENTGVARGFASSCRSLQSPSSVRGSPPALLLHGAGRPDRKAAAQEDPGPVCISQWPDAVEPKSDTHTGEPYLRPWG